MLNDVAVERFGDTAVIFVVPEERFLTVNLAAADVLEVLLQEFGERRFEEGQLAELLMEHYDVSESRARDAAGDLVNEWSAYGILKEVDGD